MEKLLCTSCGTDITNVKGSVVFKCPSCGEETIVRCGKCRQLSVKYVCKKCGFEGP